MTTTRDVPVPDAGGPAPSEVPLVLHHAFSYFAAQVTHAAARLGIADHMGDDETAVADLARRCAADPRALLRLLRAMVCLQLAEQVTPDRFVLTGHGAALRSDAPGQLRNLVMLFCSTETWRSWGELTASVRSGRTAWDDLFGAGAFDYLAAHPEQNAVFNDAMREGTLRGAPGVVATLDLAGVTTVADVGGGSGALLAAVLADRPALSGVLFDTEPGIQGAETVLRDAGVAGRCRVETGDFFVAVPEGCDAYLLKSVIHDWDDGRSTEILRRCREAAHPDSHLFVIEPVMPDVLLAGSPSAEIALFDLNMLVCTGGRERTRPEFEALLDASGFTLVSVAECTPANGYSILHAVPTG